MFNRRKVEELRDRLVDRAREIDTLRGEIRDLREKLRDQTENDESLAKLRESIRAEGGGSYSPVGGAQANAWNQHGVIGCYANLDDILVG